MLTAFAPLVAAVTDRVETVPTGGTFGCGARVLATC